MKPADLFWVHQNAVGWKKQWSFSNALKKLARGHTVYEPKEQQNEIANATAIWI